MTVDDGAAAGSPGGFTPFGGSDFGDLAAPPPSAKECGRCRRPHHVCVCAALPAARVPTRGRIIILQHPLEVPRRLGTVPLIKAACAGVAVCVGRRFDGHRTPPALASALADAAARALPVLILFPGPDAVDAVDAGVGGPAAVAAGLPAGGTRGGCDEYVLIVVDGTWRHAKQLFTAVAPHLLPPAGPAVRVGLPIGEGAAGAVAAGGRNVCAETGTITLFREPHPGCMTTAEAVARALAALEPEGCGAGDAILAGLHAVVDAQKAHDPAVVARCGGGGTAVTPARAKFGFRRPPSNAVATGVERLH